MWADECAVNRGALIYFASVTDAGMAAKREFEDLGCPAFWAKLRCSFRSTGARSERRWLAASIGRKRRKRPAEHRLRGA